MSNTAWKTDTAKIIETKICNRIDELNNWKNSNVILAPGEIALAIVVESTKPDGHGGEYSVPTVMMKVGNGESTFDKLSWVAAPASDVYSWAKELTVDAALSTSMTVIPEINDSIETIEDILAGIGSGAYATVKAAILGELAKLNSVDNNAGVITGISVASDFTGDTTITRRTLTNADFGSDLKGGNGEDKDDYNVQLPQKRIEGLTKFVSDTNTSITNINTKIDSYFDASGKVMEFVGTLDNTPTDGKYPLNIVCAKGYFPDSNTIASDYDNGACTKGHKLQKGDVVATTNDAKEYIWTTTNDSTKAIYIEDGTGTKYYWEEFGHANATDEALATLKSQVEAFADKVLTNGLTTDTGEEEKYGTGKTYASLQAHAEANTSAIGSINGDITNLKSDLNANVPKHVAENETINGKSVTNNYLTFHSASDDNAATEYIIFNCGNSHARLIDMIQE